MFHVVYHHLVISEDIPKLSSAWKEKVRRAIEQRLRTHPDLYGKPLRRSLKGYRKLRVGDYRVIFKIEKNTVKILVIQHRSAVYNAAKNRSPLMRALKFSNLAGCGIPLPAHHHLVT